MANSNSDDEVLSVGMFFIVALPTIICAYITYKHGFSVRIFGFFLTATLSYLAAFPLIWAFTSPFTTIFSFVLSSAAMIFVIREFDINSYYITFYSFVAISTIICTACHLYFANGSSMSVSTYESHSNGEGAKNTKKHNCLTDGHSWYSLPMPRGYWLDGKGRRGKHKCRYCGKTGSCEYNVLSDHAGEFSCQICGGD